MQMSSRTETLVHLIMSIIIILVLSVAAYYIGGNFLGQGIIDQAQADIAAGKRDANIVILDLPAWKTYYFSLVMYLGEAAEFILVLWIILTHWLLSSSGSTGLGKRWLWLFLGIILAALCVTVPFIFTYYLQIPLFDEVSLSALFFVCYCLIGYWGGSIFVTSDTYKYTPIFAGFFR